MNGPEPADRSGADKADRWDRAALPVVIFLFAAAVRTTPWRRVFTGDGVVFTEGDSYHHMWRIWNAASGSLQIPHRDSFANFPQGGEIIWAPGFDWVLAGIVRLLGFDRAGAELFCAWVPVLLGAVAVAFAAQLARRSFSRIAGWVTGGILAVIMGGFNYTQVGYLDHHAAVMLIGVLMLGGAMRVVATTPTGPRGWPLAAGALAAAALLTWSGSIVQCVVLQAALVVWALAADEWTVARLRAAKLALAHAIAAVSIWPVCGGLSWEIFGDFTPLALSRFHPTWLGVGAACLAVSAMLWGSETLGGSRGRRVASALGVGAVGLVLAFTAIPDLRSILDQGSSWFTDDVEFNRVNIELVPLLGAGDQLNWSRPMQLLTPLFFAYPIAAAALAWRSRRPDIGLLVYWSAAFFALTLSQSRFVNTFSVSFAIVLGGAVALLANACARWCGGRRARVVACAAATLVVACTVFEPTFRFYRSYWAPVPSGVRTVDVLSAARKESFRAAARFLAQTAPPVLDAEGKPTYAVLCEWSFGNEIRYRTGRPVIQDNFGPYVASAGVAAAVRYFKATDEAAALAELEQMGARYVLADIEGAGYRQGYGYRSMTSRLVNLRGSGGPAGPLHRFGQRRFVRALTRHRLLFYAPDERAGLHLYEIVPGASVTGVARPGASVTATLALRTASGETFEWVDRSRSDRSGRFELRLPYATHGGDFSQVTPAGSYSLVSEGAEVSLDVPESAVREGAAIEAPPFAFAAEPQDPPR